MESTEIDPLNIERIMHDIPHVISSPTFSYEDWKVMARMAESLEREYNITEQKKYK